ncbi:MAG: radical SAM protein [Clostridiales bacterium]|nr:radical SAM protein [Clostridiales bacterium]
MMKLEMKINKIINFSSVDGPGNRLVVFFQGCNLNCVYCHNPETIDYNQEGEFISVNQLFERIKKAEKYISGVTFSGGECSLQSDAIFEIGEILKKHGIKLMMDTNFTQPSIIYEKLSSCVDAFIVDMKAYNGNIHKALTGSANNQILKNIQSFYDKIYEVRVVVVPGYNDDFEEIQKILRFLYEIDENIFVKLIKFRPYGVRKPYNDIQIPEDHLMESFISLGHEIGLKNIYYK